MRDIVHRGEHRHAMPAQQTGQPFELRGAHVAGRPEQAVGEVHMGDRGGRQVAGPAGEHVVDLADPQGANRACVPSVADVVGDGAGQAHDAVPGWADNDGENGRHRCTVRWSLRA